MIATTFEKWKLLEHFGDGNETFTQKLNLHGNGNNLDILNPMSWDDVESGTGTLVYDVSLDLRSSGIEDITFSISQLDVTLEIRSYNDKDDEDGELKTVELSFTKKDIDIENVKVKVHDLPFFLRNIELDFRNAEDLDGEIDLSKVKFELDFGNIED